MTPFQLARRERYRVTRLLQHLPEERVQVGPPTPGDGHGVPGSYYFCILVDGLTTAQVIVDRRGRVHRFTYGP